MSFSSVCKFFTLVSHEYLCSDQREKERDLRLQDLRQQREERAQKTRPGAGEVMMKKIEKSADGSTVSEITKTNRFAQSGA